MRAAAGVTQADLAEQAGPDMTLSSLKSLELGRSAAYRTPNCRTRPALGTTAEAVRAAHQWDLDHADSAS